MTRVFIAHPPLMWIAIAIVMIAILMFAPMTAGY